MLGEAAGCASLDVAEQADFERDSFVENVLGEVAQLYNFAVFGDGDVFDEAGAVADAVGAAILDGLPDGLFAKAFACVNGDVEILPLDVMESVDMFLGRIAAFFPSEIETDNAAIAEVHGELRHFERDVHVAHGADDQAGRNSEVVFAAFQTL
jgi:hypothetical protein